MLTFKAAHLLRLCCCALAACGLPALAASWDEPMPSYRIGRPAPPERPGTDAFEIYRHTLQLDRLRGWDMPGVLTTSLSLTRGGAAPLPLLPHGYRYTYQTHPMLTAAWGIPLGRRFAFEGFANYIAGGYTDETGHELGDDSSVEIQLMYDVGDAFGHGKNRFRIGVEYQFGDGAGTSSFGSASAISSGRGFRTRTPVLRAEYHF